MRAGRSVGWASLPSPKGRISAREVNAASGRNRDNSKLFLGRTVKICKKCKNFGWFSLPPRQVVSY